MRQVRVAKGEPQIFLPLGQGVAGHCAQSGVHALVPDAYADSRFNADADARTGFRTRNIVAVPIKMRDQDETVIGVLQCINKSGGAAFTEADVYVIYSFRGVRFARLVHMGLGFQFSPRWPCGHFTSTLVS